MDTNHETEIFIIASTAESRVSHATPNVLDTVQSNKSGTSSRNDRRHTPGYINGKQANQANCSKRDPTEYSLAASTPPAGMNLLATFSKPRGVHPANKVDVELSRRDFSADASVGVCNLLLVVLRTDKNQLGSSSKWVCFRSI